MVRPELHARASASPALRSMQSLTSETALSLCSRLPLMALTARSLHCRDSVRLHSYFHRTGEPVSTPARDPDLTPGITQGNQPPAGRSRGARCPQVV